MKDPKFVDEMRKRVEEVTRIKSLYLDVICYEKTRDQDGNLLAQLISYYELMQLLQEKHLSVSF